MFPQIFGKYVLERELASGGMARVFLATLRGAGGFEKRLVVKQIRPELASDQSFIGRFVAEAKTTVELSHSNIVPVYELGAEQGTYYIAMEFCAGVSLDQLLSGGALTPAEGAYIGVEICRALDYAHRRAGIVHRDVTPRNVMIDPEGMVRLIDFGIAASVGGDASSQDALFGSAGHMPPEQLRRGPLTPAADVFAVAVLLVETWTGRAPFRRESFEASAKALEQSPPDIADADSRLAPLSALISQALSLEASERPQSAEEFARPLREFLRQSDLGDIARRLGQQVSEHLACGDSSSSTTVAGGARAFETSGATQTFAVRDALLEWTAKIDSRPPRASRTSAVPRLAIESAVLAPSSSNAPSFRDGPPPRSTERTPRWYRVPVALSLALAALIGSIYAVGSSVGLERGSDASEGTAEVSPVSALHGSIADGHDAPSPALVPAPVALAAVSSVAPSSTPQTAATRVGPTTTGAFTPGLQPASGHGGALGGSGRSALSSRTARVHLTAEPAALVRVDAAVVGRTPILNLGLSPGRHEVVFENELLGETLQAGFILDAAGSQRVHADFTSATPRLYLR